MSEDRLAVYLGQINDAVGDVLRYVDGMTEADFVKNELVRRTVILCLLIIGEAAAKIMDKYPAFAHRHANVPWKAMRGMRNRIAHRYFDVDLVVVWKKIRSELPDLAKALQTLA